MLSVKLKEDTNSSLFVLHSSLISSLFLLIFSQHLDFLHQRRDGIDALAIAGQIIEGEIHVEELFPFMTDAWQRLDLGEIDVVEAQDGEHLGERTLVV